MELQSVKFTEDELSEILNSPENQNKIILLQDINTKYISCSRCGNSGSNSNEIKHDSCCPYIGGGGC